MANFGGISLGRALGRRWRMIVVLTVFSIGAAAWASLGLLPKKYQATTTLLVQPLISSEGMSYDELLTNERLAVTYGEIIKSYTMARNVLRGLRLGMTETQLLKQLTVTSVKDSLVLAIGIIDPEAPRALQIANAFASSFVSSLPELMHVENVSVLDEARLMNSGKPVSPNPVLFIGVAFLLAINTGVGVAALLEFLDRTIDTEETLERILGTPVLSAIPKYTVPMSSEGSQRLAGKVPYLDDPVSEVAESFRALRTAIRQIPSKREIRTVLITSPAPRDGKSSVSAGLAVCLAQEGRKTLLIDCDLRHPSAHETFGVPNETGVSGMLSSGLPLAKCVHPTDIAGLEILPAGPPPSDPAGILSKSEFASLLSSLRSTHDMVLIDSPPLLPVADGQILAKLCDGVLLVARAEATQVEGVRKSKSLLIRVGAHVIGSVLNGQKNGVRGYYGYYGHAR